MGRRSSRTLSALVVVAAIGLSSCGEPSRGEPSPSPDAGAPSALPSGPMRARAATGSPESVLWIDRSGEMPARIAPALTDQPARGRVLLYGGWNVDSGVRGDTWEWDGIGWIRRVPENDPGPRFSASTVYDELGQRVLLFGGISGFTPTPRGSDRLTWEWNGSDWAPIVTAHAPTERAAPSLVWDPAGRRALLFGGFVQSETEATTATSDDAFWSFDGRDWTEIPKSDPWPTARGLGSMALDPRTGRFVLHGGFNFIKFTNGNLDFLSGTQYVNDTWEWDGARWARLPAVLDDIGLGAPRLVSEPATGELLMFVDGLGTSALYAMVDGQWQLRQRRAAERVFSASSWSTPNQALLVTGGSGRDPSGVPAASAVSGDYLVSSQAPFRKLPDAMPIGARVTAAAAVVRSSGDLVLFGGVDGNNKELAATRIWDGGRWRVAGANDPALLLPRRRHAMASLGEDRVLLFGGVSDGALQNDTWIWSASNETWTQDERPGPPARFNHAMAGMGDAVVLFGGDTGDIEDLFGDTWIYRADTGWQLQSPAASPPGRTYSSATPDLGGRAVLFFGGMGEGLGSVGDLWRFTGTSWEMVADHRPLIRRRGGIATDQRLGRAFTVGGTGSSSQADLWDLTEPIGRPITPLLLEDNQELPLRRHDAIFVESPKTGGITLFGGVSNEAGREQVDTWQLKSFGAPCTQSSECSVGQSCTEGVCCETSNCGPCRTCASATRPGLCAARGVFGPEAGCDAEGQACNLLGQCRLANEQSCSDDLACASNTCLRAGRDAGICCNAEGCTLRCVDGDLRGPDGNVASCAPYRCQSDRCNTECTSVEDCAAGYECNAARACVPSAQNQGEDGGCACRAVPATTRPTGLAALLLGLVLATARSRRGTRRRRHSRPGRAPR